MILDLPLEWATLQGHFSVELPPRSQQTGMLALMRRELGLERRDALALASVVVDLRVTQIVNEVRGVHAC